MRVLALLIRGLSVAVALTTRSKPKEDQPVDEVATLTEKVEHVVTGLQSLYNAQSKDAAGPTKFAQILKPFLTQVNAILGEVKTSKLTKAQKLEKLKNAQASISGLKKDMAKLTTDIKAEGEDAKDSLLLGVLMSRKNRPEAEQLEALHSDDFKELEVVKYVLAHRDAKKNLLEQVAAYLDQKHHTKVEPTFSNATAGAMTEQIVGGLSGQLKKMQVHLAEQEKLHKKIMGEFADAEHQNEAKVASLKGKDDKNKTQSVLKQNAGRAIKIAKRLEKKEDREYKKKHALLAHDISEIKTAIESIKKGDMKALEVAQKALMSSMQAMKASTGDFLHFLQLSDYIISTQGDCPYCKAQCLEKCHNDGHSFMDCMGSCANAGN